jgi:RNA polymerase sigma-70 factor (ECF subfamily)
MPDKAKSDEALMDAYVDGDPQAFEQLFARLAPRVHRFFMSSFRDRSLADDLLQTTFLKLHGAREDYQPNSPLRPWLFAIAARVRFDELRRRHRAGARASEEELSAAEDKTSPTPEQDVVQADQAARVRAALERLPHSQRTVIHLHRFEGLSFPEIARALGTTEGAVKLRAFRAYEALRTELRALLDDEVAA